MRIVMVGTGYVGLVSGACFAELGHDVICIDNDAGKVAALQRGQVPFYEPELDRLVQHSVRKNRLRFATNLAEAVAEADAVFIAVGTPARRSDGHADLSAVFAVTREIARAVRKFTVVITKSTVPLGTGDDIERIIREENPKADVAVVSNPEFLREGSAIDDFMKPDRVVIGLEDERARDVMGDLYQPLARDRVPVLYASRRAAELIKYGANAFLAVKITFINEMADLCEQAGADIREVSRGIGLDSRIGSRFLEAGPGFGGSCFPKDTLAIIKAAQDFDRPLRIVETTVAVNEQRKRGMARKVMAACGGTVRGKTIAVLGLTFKAETDDMRGAPSIDIIRALQDYGATVRVFDPVGMASASKILENVTFATDSYDAAFGADAVVVVTDWEMFGALDLLRLKSFMADPILVDLRNLFQPGEVTRHGIAYIGLGCPVDGAPQMIATGTSQTTGKPPEPAQLIPLPMSRGRMLPPEPQPQPRRAAISGTG
jgi:UDPglucose 6-dehydrogenase